MKIKSEKITASFVFLIFYIFFLLTLAQNFSASHDSIDYLVSFEAGEDLFNSHHILYHISTYGIFSLLKLLLPGVPHYFLLESVNSLWGSAALVVIFYFFRNRFRYDNITSFICCCLPAFSFGIWFYSTNIEVYMPSLFFLLFTLYFITKKDISQDDIKKIIALHILSILFHQVNILFTPIVLWKLWMERKRFSFIKNLLVYALSGILVTSAIYYCVGKFILKYNSTGEIILWMRGYTTQSAYWFPISLSTLGNAAIGFIHAFAGAQFIFKVSFIETYLHKRFFYHSLNDEMFLVQSMSHTLAMVLLIFSVILTAIFAFLFGLAIKKRKEIWAGYKHIILPLSFFFIIYSVFFYFWMPENLEFWIPQMTVLWIILLGSVSIIRFKLNRKILFSLMAFLLFCINYFGSIKWLTNLNYDYYYIKSAPLHNRATENDLILLEDAWIVKNYLSLYTKSSVKLIPKKDKPEQKKQIDSLVTKTLNGGNRIYIFTDKSFMHSIKNEQYVDSLLQSGHTIDSIRNEAGRILILHK